MLLETIATTATIRKIGPFEFSMDQDTSAEAVINVQVRDSGGLLVGEFGVDYSEKGNLKYLEFDREDADILERLRKTGASDSIVRMLHHKINSLSAS